MQQQPPDEPKFNAQKLEYLKKLRIGNIFLLNNTVTLDRWGETRLTPEQYFDCLQRIYRLFNTTGDNEILEVINIILRHNGNVTEIERTCGFESRRKLNRFSRLLSDLWRQICKDYLEEQTGFQTNPKVTQPLHSALVTTSYEIVLQLEQRKNRELIEARFDNLKSPIVVELLGLLKTPEYKVPPEQRKAILALVESNRGNTEFLMSLYELAIAFIKTTYPSHRKLFVDTVRQEGSVLSFMIMLREQTSTLLKLDDRMVNSEGKTEEESNEQ